MSRSEISSDVTTRDRCLVASKFYIFLERDNLGEGKKKERRTLISALSLSPRYLLIPRHPIFPNLLCILTILLSEAMERF